MKAIYVQKGNSLDYKNETNETIEAGEVVIVGNRAGIAGTVIPVGELGSINMHGVFKIPKKATEEIAAWAEVYYGEDGVTAVSGTGKEVKIGYAVSEASADDTYVKVKLTD